MSKKKRAALKEEEHRAQMAADIWAFGCLVAFAGTGESLYTAVVVSKVLRGEMAPADAME